MQNVISRYF